MKKIILILFLLGKFSAQAQESIYFSKIYPNSHLETYRNSILVHVGYDSSVNMVFGSVSNFLVGIPDSDILPYRYSTLLKFTTNGETIAQYEFITGSGNIEATKVDGLTIASDALYVFGNIEVFAASSIEVKRVGFIAKFNKELGLIWRVELPNALYKESAAHRGKVDEEGNLIFSYATYTNPDDVNEYFPMAGQRIHLAKLSPDGVLLSDTVLEETGGHIFIFGDQLPNGDIMGYGYSYNYSSRRSGILQRVDSQANELWRIVHRPEYYATAFADMARSKEVTTTPYYYAVGSSMETSAFPDYIEGLVVKLDTEGNILWERRGGAEDLVYYLSGCVGTADGGIAAVGTLDYETEGPTTDRGWIYKLDADGNEVFSRRLSHPPPGPYYHEMLYDIAELPNGDLLVAGSTRYISPIGNNDQVAWLKRVDAMGCSEPDCTLGAEDVPLVNMHFELYPNPGDGQVQISLGNGSDEAMQLHVYDMSGRLLVEAEIPTGVQVYTLDLPKTAAPGNYLIRMSNGKGSMMRKYVKTQ